MVQHQPRVVLGLVLLLALSACAGFPGVPQDRDCGATRLQEFVGQPVVEVAAIETPGPVRILAPGSVMTHDYVPDRLNIFTDDAGIVTELSCG